MAMRLVMSGCLAVLALVFGKASLEAQHPLEGAEWTPIIRPSGQLVAPVFEGHYPNADGTHTLIFGYHNLNSDEAVDIPLGPDNYIEPREYDGMQPTHFEAIPENGSRRGFGVFAVVVPAGFEGDVVWNLRHRGYLWSIPGHVRNAHYLLDAVDAEARLKHAPVMKFRADEEGWRGKNGQVVGPLTVRVGEPLPLNVFVYPDRAPQEIVWWFKHQGPGEVTFDPWESELGPEGGEVTATATFSAPGQYMLRTMAVESIADIEFHCCWTNGYVRVNVTE